MSLPERKEGTVLCSFLENWLPEVLGADDFPGPLVIERAHRLCKIYDAHVQSAVKPNVVIMKVLNYADKSHTLILLDNKKVMFFPTSLLNSSSVEKSSTFETTKAVEKFVEELRMKGKEEKNETKYHQLLLESTLIQ